MPESVEAKQKPKARIYVELFDNQRPTCKLEGKIEGRDVQLLMQVLPMSYRQWKEKQIDPKVMAQDYPVKPPAGSPAEVSKAGQPSEVKND